MRDLDPLDTQRFGLRDPFEILILVCFFDSRCYGFFCLYLIAENTFVYFQSVVNSRCSGFFCLYLIVKNTFVYFQSVVNSRCAGFFCLYLIVENPDNKDSVLDIRYRDYGSIKGRRKKELLQNKYKMYIS